jgi:hypothetical protein
MLPKASSPVVNAVPNANCPIKVDQRGVHRPQGPRCDMGAVERKSSDPSVASTLAASPAGSALSAGAPNVGALPDLLGRALARLSGGVTALLPHSGQSPEALLRMVRAQALKEVAQARAHAGR